MCLSGAARVWYTKLPAVQKANIDKIYVLFLSKYRSTGLDWCKEASFQFMTQLPHEQVHHYANRIAEQGTKIGKSDRDMLNQFVKGLHAQIKTHTIATGPSSLEQAIKAAALYESARAFSAEVEPTVMMQGKEKSGIDPRKLPQKDQVQCRYCRRMGHKLEDCTVRQENNQKRQDQTQQYSDRLKVTVTGQAQGDRAPASQPVRSVFLYVTCYNCQEKGHIRRDCPSSARK